MIKTFDGRRSPSPDTYANKLKLPNLASPKNNRHRSPKKYGSINMGLVFDDDLRKAAAKLFRMEEEIYKSKRMGGSPGRNLSPIVKKCLQPWENENFLIN